MKLLDILNGNRDVPLLRNFRDADDITRQFQRSELPIAETRLLKTNENYFIHTEKLYTCLLRACAALHQRLNKTTLTDVHQDFFKKLDETTKCTWKLLCNCWNWNIYDKLRQNWTRTVKGGNHLKDCSEAFPTNTTTATTFWMFYLKRATEGHVISYSIKTFWNARLLLRWE